MLNIGVDNYPASIGSVPVLLRRRILIALIVVNGVADIKI